MKKKFSNVLSARPKTVAMAIAVALYSNAALAGTCPYSGSIGSQTCAGGAGDTNIVNISNLTLTVPDGLAIIGLTTGAEVNNVTITGNNTINMGNAGWDAMRVGDTTLTNSSSSVTINAGSSLNITGTHPGTTAAGGISVYGQGTGAATITHNGTGTISTQGGNGLLAQTFGSGNASVTITGGAVIETYANTVNGIHADAAGTGNASVDSNATITTNGSSWAPGIQVSSRGGSASLINRGSITTNGANSYGLYISSTGGQIDVTNTGSVTTNGLNSDAISATRTTAGSSNITITNSGSLTTQGGSGINANIDAGSGSIIITHNAGSTISANTAGGATANRGEAIRVGINSASGGDAKVYIYGDVENFGSTTAADTVFVNNGGVGDSLIKATGNVTNHNTATDAKGLAITQIGAGKATIDYNNSGTGVQTVADGGHALYAFARGAGAVGGISIIANGNLHTGDSGTGTGVNAAGIRAAIDTAATSGDINVDFQGGSIVTEGDGADGIWASIDGASSGNIVITAAGSIETKSQNAAGANAYGIVATTKAGANSTGNISITFTGSRIETGLNSNSDAIIIAQRGSGTATVSNSGSLITHGQNSAGIWAEATTGKVTVTNNGNITTEGNTADGINASTTTGDIKIDVQSGTITVGGVGIANSNGIKAQGGGNIDITSKATIINNSNSATANIADGIIAGVNSGSGYIKIIAEGDITLDGGVAGLGAHGINADHSGSLGGDTTIGYSNGTIWTKQDNQRAIETNNYDAAGFLNVTNSGTLLTYGLNSTGISANIHNATNSSAVTISNSGQVTTQGDSTSAASLVGSHALSATSAGNGNILVDNSGVLATSGDIARGISAWGKGSGLVEVENTANITTQGLLSQGIYAESTSGNITINNTGDISTQGAGATGIYGYSTSGGAIDIDNSSSITTADATGILASTSSGDAAIRVNNDITTSKASATTHAHGIEAGTSANGKASVYYDNGTIKVGGTTVGGGGSIGIAAWDHGTGASTVDGYISIGANAIVDATEAFGAVLLGVSGTGVLDIAQGAQIHGGANGSLGNGYGISLSGTGSSANHTVNNSGVIDSLNDQAITGSVVGGTALIENHGTVTGYVTFADGSTVTFNNHSPNSLDLRNFADTDGDGVRDTKAVSVSTFGGLNSTFNNTANGVVRLLPVSGETSTVTTGQYLSDGLSIYDTARSGVVQAQLLNLGTFVNSGLIDLTAGGKTGDTLIISGGNTPGVNGGGTYVSNGGVIKMDVTLNPGDTLTDADLLVVDNVKLGSAPTTLQLNIIRGAVGLTRPDGIKLVDVLGTSDAGAFKLDTEYLANGPFEYRLFNGAFSNPNNQSWYLRNVDENGRPMFSAKVGSYLANQTAATSMFMHTLHDRLGEPQFTEGYKAEGKIPSVWVRVAASHTDSEAVEGSMDQDTDSQLVQFGGELAQWTNGTSRLHLGLMGAYGESETDTTVNRSRNTSNGKVTGYSVGTYATWYQNQSLPRGLYLDGWLQYGWFDNKVNAPGERSESYDSEVFTASLEAGYAFVAGESETRQWMIEPQAQIAYNDYSADDHVDSSGMKISGNDASGIVTRLGARVYSRSKLGDNGIQPFVEANWWYGSANNSLKFDGYEAKDGVPENRFEAKLGLQGEVAKGWQMWGHVGGMWGSDSYDRYEGMIGLKKLF